MIMFEAEVQALELGAQTLKLTFFCGNHNFICDGSEQSLPFVKMGVAVTNNFRATLSSMWMRINNADF